MVKLLGILVMIIFYVPASAQTVPKFQPQQVKAPAISADKIKFLQMETANLRKQASDLRDSVNKMLAATHEIQARLAKEKQSPTETGNKIIRMMMESKNDIIEALLKLLNKMSESSENMRNAASVK